MFTATRHGGFRAPRASRPSSTRCAHITVAATASTSCHYRAATNPTSLAANLEPRFLRRGTTAMCLNVSRMWSGKVTAPAHVALAVLCFGLRCWKRGQESQLRICAFFVQRCLRVSCRIFAQCGCVLRASFPRILESLAVMPGQNPGRVQVCRTSPPKEALFGGQAKCPKL